ncbi:hypothetical protein LTR37_008948 [Vermiconidia calcicola]|uniref:Uncharacterized protein n=1 Tax=Vermiconidia calcicola TaxID=1690605 RepID=A0ACC3N9F0_9PEZI|nr:hypothetical protein LTR37_008948 [Vermiconidia calcicola]
MRNDATSLAEKIAIGDLSDGDAATIEAASMAEDLEGYDKWRQGQDKRSAKWRMLQKPAKEDKPYAATNPTFSEFNAITVEVFFVGACIAPPPDDDPNTDEGAETQFETFFAVHRDMPFESGFFCPDDDHDGNWPIPPLQPTIPEPPPEEPASPALNRSTDLTVIWVEPPELAGDWDDPHWHNHISPLETDADTMAGTSTNTFDRHNVVFDWPDNLNARPQGDVTRIFSSLDVRGAFEMDTIDDIQQRIFDNVFSRVEQIETPRGVWSPPRRTERNDIAYTDIDLQDRIDQTSFTGFVLATLADPSRVNDMLTLSHETMTGPWLRTAVFNTMAASSTLRCQHLRSSSTGSPSNHRTAARQRRPSF